MKNNITNPNWWYAAAVRALKTICQTAVALIGTSATGFLSVDWLEIFSVSAMAGLVSLLTSIAGLPEVDGSIDYDEGDDEGIGDDWEV